MSLTKVLQKFTELKNNYPKAVCAKSFKTDLGELIAIADNNFLYAVFFSDSKNLEKKLQSLAEELKCHYIEGSNKVLNRFEDELRAYFEGNLKKFTVPIKTFGSDFQKEVWEKLQDLPYASTQTYGDLAKAMGKSASHARAIGAACGANSHLLVIPCHRLVASGSKGGFSCGIDRKEWLLQHEAKYAT